MSRHIDQSKELPTHANGNSFVAQSDETSLPSPIHFTLHVSHSSPSLSPSSINSPMDKLFKCDYQDCHKSFKCQRYLTDHIRNTHSNRLFVCAVKGCNTVCKNKRTLLQHFKDKHCDELEGTFKCEQEECRISFKRKRYLTSHIWKVHSDRLNLCDVQSLDPIESLTYVLENKKPEIVSEDQESVENFDKERDIQQQSIASFPNSGHISLCKLKLMKCSQKGCGKWYCSSKKLRKHFENKHSVKIMMNRIKVESGNEHLPNITVLRIRKRNKDSLTKSPPTVVSNVATNTQQTDSIESDDQSPSDTIETPLPTKIESVIDSLVDQDELESFETLMLEQYDELLQVSADQHQEYDELQTLNSWFPYSDDDISIDMEFVNSLIEFDYDSASLNDEDAKMQSLDLIEPDSFTNEVLIQSEQVILESDALEMDETIQKLEQPIGNAYLESLHQVEPNKNASQTFTSSNVNVQ